jgi:hypothetical protein
MPVNRSQMLGLASPGCQAIFEAENYLELEMCLASILSPMLTLPLPGVC